MTLEESWKITRGHLDRAKALLAGAKSGTLREYREYLDNNELALDQLEALGESTPCPPEFWAAMEAAAASMKLEDRARRLRSRQGGESR